MAENGNANGMAKWPLWAQLIAMLGFPIVVAIYMMGQQSGWIPSAISDTKSMMTMHTMNDTDRNRLLRVMCRHQATSLRQNPDECDSR